MNKKINGTGKEISDEKLGRVNGRKKIIIRGCRGCGREDVPLVNGLCENCRRQTVGGSY